MGKWAKNQQTRMVKPFFVVKSTNKSGLLVTFFDQSKNAKQSRPNKSGLLVTFVNKSGQNFATILEKKES